MDGEKSGATIFVNHQILVKGVTIEESHLEQKRRVKLVIVQESNW